MDNERYDPYVPRDGAPSGSGGPSSDPAGGNNPNSSMQKAKDEIERTKRIMEDNIRNVAERGDRLDALRDKTDNLAVSAQGFRKGANRVRKNMWWKDMKMRIIIGVGIAILLVIIIVPIVKATQGK